MGDGFKDVLGLVGRVASLDREVYERVPKLFEKLEAAIDNVESESRTRDDELRRDLQAMREDLAGFRGKVEGFAAGVAIAHPVPATSLGSKALSSGDA